MASADLLLARAGSPRSPRLSSKLYSRVRLQISPNKNVNFRCASSPSTLESVGNGFAIVRLAHLRISLGLYGVSVRSLAALARMLPTTIAIGDRAFAGFLPTVCCLAAVALA